MADENGKTIEERLLKLEQFKEDGRWEKLAEEAEKITIHFSLQELQDIDVRSYD